MQSERLGDWIQTATGGMFWPLDPRPEEIDVLDIAHALANMCRYGGHCLRFYSVAEHSVLMARHVSPPNRLWALLHDASEAYIVDVPRPLKRFLVGYQAAEDDVMKAVCQRFGMSVEMPHEVKAADSAILVTEMLHNMAPPPKAWAGQVEPLEVTLKFWSPDQARDEFIKTYKDVKTQS